MVLNGCFFLATIPDLAYVLDDVDFDCDSFSFGMFLNSKFPQSWGSGLDFLQEPVLRDGVTALMHITNCILF